MNYIAHIHLAKHTHTSLVGNFLGDFIKGSALDNLPLNLQHGIRLHRHIDVFTDSHPIVLGLKRDFPKSIRRYAGIILDVYFDHLLIQHWKQFSSPELSQNKLFSEFYRGLAQLDLDISPQFSRVRSGLLDYQWLADYRELSACLRAMHAIENRFSRKLEFAEQAIAYIAANESQLKQSFLHFYPDLLGHSELFVSKLER